MNRRRSTVRRPARFNPVRMLKGLLLEMLGFATLVALYFTLNGTNITPTMDGGRAPSLSIAGMWSSAINLAADSHTAGATDRGVERQPPARR